MYFDDTGEVRGASPVWRRGHFVGVRLLEAAPPGALSRSDRFALSERYYAMRD